MSFSFSQSTGRYRDNKTGRFVTDNKVRSYSDDLVVETAKRLKALAIRYDEATVSKTSWKNGFIEELQNLALTNFALGRGGVNQFTNDDKDALSEFMLAQRGFLVSFANDLDNMSVGQIIARSNMYAKSTRTMFEFGRSRSIGIPDLPVYPGVGSECLVNCKCHWRYEKRKGKWYAYWERTVEESCPTCVDREKKYSPYVVE